MPVTLIISCTIFFNIRNHILLKFHQIRIMKTNLSKKTLLAVVSDVLVTLKQGMVLQCLSLTPLVRFWENWDIVSFGSAKTAIYWYSWPAKCSTGVHMNNPPSTTPPACWSAGRRSGDCASGPGLMVPSPAMKETAGPGSAAATGWGPCTHSQTHPHAIRNIITHTHTQTHTYIHAHRNRHTHTQSHTHS